VISRTHAKSATARNSMAGLIALISALLVMALVGATAQARDVRPFTGKSFGHLGTGTGNFESLGSITVDQRTGDIYVYELQDGGRLYKFNSSGEPEDFSSTKTNVIDSVGIDGGASEVELAVDGSTGPAAGDIYVATNQSVRIYGASGAPLGELTGGETCGVATDSSGAVYVGAYPETVRKYVPVGNPVTSADETASMKGLTAICNLAVDGEGNVYAATYYGGIHKYEASQFGSMTAEGTLIDASGRTLAVDPSDNHVFINEGSRIAEYDATGKVVSVAGEGELSGSFGVAFGGPGNYLYADGPGFESRVELFGEPVIEPDATTEAVSGMTSTSATLHGSVNPDGTATTYQFEYGTSTSYGSVAPASPAAVGSDSTVHQLSASLTGLARSSTYHYRIVASNANGSTYGADETFDTSGPPTIYEASVPHVGQRSATFVVALDPHGLDTHDHFEYGPTSGYGSTTPAADLGAEGEYLVDQPEVTGLELGTTYHYRVVVSNSEGTVDGPDQTFATSPAEQIADVGVTEITGSSAKLSGEVNDFEVPATYHFEYGTTSTYGSSTPSTALQAAEYQQPVSATLSGLAAGTTYHLRLVAESAAGTTYGPDVAFTTESATVPAHVLPDGRGYEKVTPADNADGDVYQDVPLDLGSEGGYTELPFLVAPSGNAITYLADPSEKGGIGREGAGYGNQFLATRDASGGWKAVNIEPASTGFFDVPIFKGFSPDLSVGFVNSKGTTPLAPDALTEGFSDLYAETLSTGSYESLTTTTPPHRTPAEFGAYGTPTVSGSELAYAGSSADLGHELYEANDALTPNAEDGGEEENNLYDFSGGSSTLVNVLPDGTTEANATFGGPHLSADGSENSAVLGHDISEDGSRIFWTDLNTHSLYVRENDTASQSPIEAGKCTVPTDACTVLIAENAQFWNATADGSRVLYSAGGDLYEHDLESGETVDLAPAGEVRGVTAASEDLSYVYFVAGAVLAPGAEHQSCQEGEGSPTDCNLYAVHVGEPVRFIGALSGADNIARPESFGQYDGPWQGSLANSEAETTPDGTQLLFGSKAHLTSYNNGKSEQIYMYNYAGGELDCLSCKPSGEAITQQNSAFLPVSHVGTALPHWMSDDGNRVFFDTLSALVPQDTNEKTDVYEWERDGSGSCTQSPGCIYLLTDGTSPEGSYLIGASTSGDDVFITTRGKLLAEDENENIDIYDVRVGAVNPPAPPQCTGSGCQGLPSTPPIFATPPSLTYNGVGNFEPVKALTPAKPKAKPLTKAQKLASALRKCKKEPKKKRAACEKQAQKKYGAKTSKVPSSKKRGSVKKSSGRGK
jgi:hypothetical protein